MLEMLGRLVESNWRHRRIIGATTLIELRKRYAGGFIGPLWLVLYPVLFLSVYLFVWLVVFQVKFTGFTTLDYVVFVFAGLVPFLVFSDTCNTSIVTIRQNIHLVKGLVIPIEILPVRTAAIAAAGQAIALALVALLSALNGTLSWPVLLLPIVVLLHMTFLVGLALFLAPTGVLLPDSAQLVQLFTTLLMFLSPIAFKADMVPAHVTAILILNPVTYFVEAYRATLIAGHAIVWWQIYGFVVMSIVTFLLGAIYCARFKDFIADFE